MHRGVELAPARLILLTQEPVVHGADQLHRDECEVVAPEAELASCRTHLLLAGVEAGEHLQVAPFEPGADGVEGTRLHEQVAVEIAVESAEQVVEGIDPVFVQDFGERGRGAAGGSLDVSRIDDLPIFQIRDEHRLHQQGLGCLRDQAALLKQVVRLLEIAQEHAIHALVRVELFSVLLPVPAGFHAVDQIPYCKRISDLVEHVDQAGLVEGLRAPVGRGGGERVDSDRFAAHHGENACNSLIPKIRVNACDACRVHLPGCEEHRSRKVLDAEHRSRAQVAQGGSYRPRVWDVANLRSVLVEIGGTAGAQTQALLPVRRELILQIQHPRQLKRRRGPRRRPWAA